MRFKKKLLAELNHCYAALIANMNGHRTYLFAPDDTGPCLAIDAQTLQCTQVWAEPGGTMSIITLPGENGDILASQRFMPGFRAKAAQIVRARMDKEAWELSLWMRLPYVHRFDIIEHADRTWFLGCILSGTEEEQADWDVPGGLVVAELNRELDPPVELTTLAAGMHKNHGYCRTRALGEEWILTACDEGIYRLTPPERDNAEWQVSCLVNTPASDVAVCDLDEDGVPELIVISPFHGNQIEIYRQIGGEYQRVCFIEHHSSFLHAIWAGSLLGENIALIGGRADAKETMMISFRNGRYQSEIIEEGFGASNFYVDGNEILVANREVGECALLTAVPD